MMVADCDDEAEVDAEEEDWRDGITLRDGDLRISWIDLSCHRTATVKSTREREHLLKSSGFREMERDTYHDKTVDKNDAAADTICERPRRGGSLPPSLTILDHSPLAKTRCADCAEVSLRFEEEERGG